MRAAALMVGLDVIGAEKLTACVFGHESRAWRAAPQIKRGLPAKVTRQRVGVAARESVAQERPERGVIPVAHRPDRKGPDRQGLGLPIRR